MKNLKAKLQKKGGFTLIEMLIVVAIIAILVAVSIPLVGTALDRARQATDDANLRAAKAEATIVYMNNQMLKTPKTITELNTNYCAYDITSGTLTSTKTACNKATQGTNAAGTAYIKVEFKEVKADDTSTPTDQIVIVSWEKA